MCHVARRTTQVLPEDGALYASAAKIQNMLVDKRPLAVVYAESESDVARAIAAVRNWSLAVAVRSGGHSYAGFSVSGAAGLTIDISRMDRVALDAGSSTCHVCPEHGSASSCVWPAGVAFLRGTAHVGDKGCPFLWGGVALGLTFVARIDRSALHGPQPNVRTERFV